jgi:hypothetical protein
MPYGIEKEDLAEGVTLLLGVSYQGSNSGRVYTYAGVNVAGRWYFSGLGRTPQDAGWAAVERWLESDGRIVQWIRKVTETEMIYTGGPVPVTSRLGREITS